MINQINILFIDKSAITVLSKDEFKQLGCHVDFFEDEVFALQKACEQKYDAILCNIEIHHKNSGIQLISLIKRYSKINNHTPIYGLDIDEHNEYTLQSKAEGLAGRIPIFNKEKAMLYIKEIINNLRLANNHKDESIPLSDSNKDFLLAKTLELIGNYHGLLIGDTPQSTEDIIKLFSDSFCDIDVAFDYEIIKRKLALNTYDFVLIDLDKTHLEMDDNLVYFTRNFSTKNRDTTIFGFSTENSDEIKKDVRICAHINHVMNFPFTAEDIELMITLARWKIDATFHKYTLQNSITSDRS